MGRGSGKWLLVLVVLAALGLLSYVILSQPPSSNPASAPAKNQTSSQAPNQTSPPNPPNQTNATPPQPSPSNLTPASTSTTTQPNQIKIASWNLQIFGQSKASNSTLLDRYASIMKDYDVVFVQEIRDSSGTAFAALCQRMANYSCINSSRAGRSSSKEQYGLMFRPSVQLVQWTDYNPAQSSLFERPPAEAKLRIGNYLLDAYIIHVKPSNVSAELYELQSLVPDRGNVMLLGDFNADCSYFEHSQHADLFANWTWAVADGEDTTVAASNCTYDRILLNANASAEYARHGVLKSGITPDLSDHYLVWVEIIPQER
jgi:endonuclease/exonuclease/phosphatase family metal-dependent hydrolase